MILLYRFITFLIYPLLIIVIYYRKVLKKEDPQRFKEKIFPSHYNIERKKRDLIWFHAASIGEFKSIIPIIVGLKKKYNNLEFLVTTTTFSSGKLAVEEIRKLKNVKHRYFPVDVGFLIERFLFLWDPKAIILVDSEIWPNLITIAKKNEIPIGLINARITNKTYNKWMAFPKTAKKIFRCFSFCLVSNLETKKYLLHLNVKNTLFKGNIKFINSFKKVNYSNLIKKKLSNLRFWLAASTHEGEEVFCLKTHHLLKKKFPDIITIIAPRHIDRVERIKKLCIKYKLNAQILKKNESISKNKEIIIINSFGTLNNYFRHAKSVFIGKSTVLKLKNDSGQNPIDAAKLGCKIYHGPYVYNFEDIYKFLRRKNIAKMIKKPSQLSKFLTVDLKKKIKKNIKSKQQLDYLERKILKDTMRSLDNFLFNEVK